MLNDVQRNQIEGLYIEYQQEIKLLMFYVESKYHKFPRGLLKEFRDVFDHISRCYVEDATEDLINENIVKAKNHFNRIKLDTYKYLHDYKSREYERWKRKYSRYDLESIHDGEMWKEILDNEKDAENFFDKARKIEPRNIDDACDYLQDSIQRYKYIENTIYDNREFIVKIKRKYFCFTVLNQIPGFILGIIASLIASMIWQAMH